MNNHYNAINEEIGFMNINWNQLLNNIAGVCTNIVLKLLASAIIFFVGRAIIKFVVKKLSNSKKMSKLDLTVKNFVVSFVKIAAYVLLTVSIVAIMGVPMASIIAVIGSVGVAISLAVQGTLSNLASGLMILVFKPFKLGDFVEAGGDSGTVTDMGIFYTTLTTGDNRTIVMPNSSIPGTRLLNYSKTETRRVDIQLDVEYGTDIELVKKTVLEEVNKCSEVINDPAPFVRLTEMKDSSLCVTLRVWCKAGDFWGLKFKLLENLNNEFENKGINFAYPHMSVEIKDKK